VKLPRHGDLSRQVRWPVDGTQLWLACREADTLNLEYGIPGLIMFNEDQNGQTRVWLKHPDRYVCCAASWAPAAACALPAAPPPWLMPLAAAVLPCSSMGTEIYLQGATLTQWLRPDGTPALDSHPAVYDTIATPGAHNAGAGLRLAFPQVQLGPAASAAGGAQQHMDAAFF
jgi:hypothetical protein